jgi:acetoin utilization protein AcuB
LIANDAIDLALPYLKPADRISRALEMMADNHVSTLAVVSKGKLDGMVTEDALLQYEDHVTIADVEKMNVDVFAHDNDHLLSIIRLFADWNISVIPVIDHKDNYLGCITPANVLAIMGHKSWITEPGGILVLEIKAADFSFAEIARIVESNNANILYAETSLNKEAERIEITAKINKQDLKDIMQSFERFNYEVKATFHASVHNDDMKERYDSLMMYLNV